GCAYVVVEVQANEDGFTTTTDVSPSVTLSPGDTYEITFTNRRDDTPPPSTPTNTPDPEETPTDTPDPTETPVDPGETPTDDPTEDPTETPTPIDEVAGDITPGPGV